MNKYIEYELEGKTIRIPRELIEKSMEFLDVDEEEAIEIYLEDEGYLINEEQEALCKKTKENKSLNVIKAKATAAPKKETEKKKTQRERTVKANPTKEKIIEEIAKVLPSIATDIVIENKAKIITFKIEDKEFKIDLTEKRKKKGE